MHKGIRSLYANADGSNPRSSWQADADEDGAQALNLSASCYVRRMNARTPECARSVGFDARASPCITVTWEAGMDPSWFDRMAHHLSRRSLAALLVTHFASGQGATTAAKGVGPCGGKPTQLTTLCGNIGACETDADCAKGCACIERRAGCCYSKRRKRGKPRKRGCVDGLPALYCTATLVPTGT